MTIESSLTLSDIVRNVGESRDLLVDIFDQISNITTEGEVLNITVDIVHQILKCDRVVIYSLLSSNRGKIVAEALTPGYTPTIDSIISDPCFEARYISKYQKGRVKAITDIHKAGMSSCYVENLEKIEVKAKLVVPLIAPDGSLYGLLVMHQCSQPRQWKQSETKFVLKVANWAMQNVFRVVNYERLQTQLVNHQQWRQLRQKFTQEIHQQDTLDNVLKLAVEQAKTVLNCDRVVIYALQDKETGKIVAEATNSALAPILNSVIIDPCFEYRYQEKYQKGRVRAINNIHTAGMSPCYFENLAKLGVKSNLVAPINQDNGEIYGLLVAHQCFNFRDWQPDEIELMQEIGMQTGICISKARLKEKLKSNNFSAASLEIARDTITIAKSKMQEIQQPLQDSSGLITEMSNLYKLLTREIALIDRVGSLEVMKETKLIKIMLKKLSVAIAKMNNSLGKFNNSNNKLQQLLEDAAIDIYNHKSNK